jgi:alpha-glucan, water dikinase
MDRSVPEESTSLSTESGAALVISRRTDAGTTAVTLRLTGRRGSLLHWGLRARNRSDWFVPPPGTWPGGSSPYGPAAVQTPWTDRDGPPQIEIELNRGLNASSIEFVLYYPADHRWDNNSGHNYRIPLGDHGGGSSTAHGTDAWGGLADVIVERETGTHSWTLMHRFDLCHDLIDRLEPNDTDGLALIFVWLRYSATRQLDWQRRFNTKPKELSHSLDRLTQRLTRRYVDYPGERDLVRLALTTLGRGGDGQRVRDEVLNIMHRRHITEVSGHFIEEWHQKLHNNTTSDDIVICEAYLEFLRSDGRLDAFYGSLERGGVTRERLSAYERPIRSEPQFVPHLKGALVNDFEHFLGILRSVHEGTDLGSAIAAARGHGSDELRRRLEDIWRDHQGRGIAPSALVARVNGARALLHPRLGGDTPTNVARDLLFLDVALEQFARIVAERSAGADVSDDEAIALTGEILDCLAVSPDGEPFGPCGRHWARLRGEPRERPDWALEAHAALDRVSLVVGDAIDRDHARLQGKAERLGRALRVAQWAIDGFTEAVVRGRPLFAASLLAARLEPRLRKTIGLGEWQLVSPARVDGVVEIAESLSSVQGRPHAVPTVLVADRVSGEEEIPPGTVAVLTAATVDVLSHVAVRARNAGVLVATGTEAGIARLKALRGRRVMLTVTGGGDLAWEDTSARPGAEVGNTLRSVPTPAAAPAGAAPSAPGFVVLQEVEFRPGRVGNKAWNLKRLRGLLPDWIDLPTSLALPYGVFEETLADPINLERSRRYRELAGLIATVKDDARDAVLGELRAVVRDLAAPPALSRALEDALRESHLQTDGHGHGAWQAITRVWSSRWNARAYLSRTARLVPDDALWMGVLVQRVVEAEYAFVIHTLNPLDPGDGQLYAEVVLGLGESLVGNHAGRALGFTARKGQPPVVTHYPSKSAGLFGGGLIFRSDSSGEDLAGHAGAGLYDSVMVPSPRAAELDYTDERLLRDEAFRQSLLASVADLGWAVEAALGGPQDVEGVFANGRHTVVQARAQVAAG